MKNIDNAIKETLEIKFTYVDLFYAFCEAKGIGDPETYVTSDEEYEALENEFARKIKFNDLYSLGAMIYANGLEAIKNKMAEVERR